MAKVKVAAFSISVDGFGAGLDQDLANPLGRGGELLHRWLFQTRTFHRMHSGDERGSTGVDEAFAARSFDDTGAWIIGRNMFGPIRGPWPDHDWKGWWGSNPPYHTPVFVLTHHARPPLEMEGGTIFHFVNTGIEAALERAREAAAGQDVRIGGGVATLRAYLQAGLIDEMHLALSPVLLGRGETVFADLDLPALGYQVEEQVAGEAATHLIVSRGCHP